MNSSPTYCIITGAASGIGRALTEAFLKADKQVMALDLNAEGLEKLRADFAHVPPHQLLTAAMDIRNLAAWQEQIAICLQHWPRIDLLLNNAGYLKPGYVYNSPAEEIDAHLDINAKGLMLGTHAVMEHFMANGAGHIINIASLAGLAPIPGLHLYSTSKFAVRAFSLAIAEELRPHGIAVTVICPDAVHTPMLDLQTDYPEAALTFSGSRFLQVDDLVQLVMKRALPKRPLEIFYPASRGLQAKLVSFFPRLTRLFHGPMYRKGLKRQSRPL